jgi:N-formylglutamate amidohydrolase
MSDLNALPSPDPLRQTAGAPAHWPDAAHILAPGPGMPGVPVVFASPHSGSHYPETLLARTRLLPIVLRRTEDAFVDELFADAPHLGAPLISAEFARSFVDVNRAACEIDADMFEDAPSAYRAQRANERVRAGLGCLPRVAAGGEEIYDGPLPWSEGRHRLAHVHAGYHAALKRLVTSARLQGGGKAVLIDCHSMPSNVRKGARAVPHIVLGDRFGSSCSHRLIAAAERAFRSLGYQVGRNAPYAGGYTTRTYGRPRVGIHALQIEINRALYMDEASVTRHDRFEQVRSDMEKVIEALTSPQLLARL